MAAIASSSPTRSRAWWSSCMRFPDGRALAAALLALASLAAGAATPAAVKNEIAARLRGALPDVAPASYALGSAAFDEALRAQQEENAAAGDAAAQAGKKLWERRFRN